MRISNLQPVANPGGGVRAIAVFDLELSAHARLYGLRLMEAADGKRWVYAAQAGSRRSATFSRELSEAITAAAIIELEAATAHDISRRTA